MEKRKAKMIVNESGSGSSTFRVTIPTKWIRKMDLGEDSRNLIISYNEKNKEIIIKKED